MSSQFKRVLIVIFAIALPLAAAPHLMTRFGTPPFISSMIQADHQRKLAAAGGIWCFQFNPDGSARDVSYGAEKCGTQASQPTPIGNLLVYSKSR